MYLWLNCYSYILFLPSYLQNNNLERALDWIFSHAESEEDSETASQSTDAENNANNGILTDGLQEGPRVKDGNGSKSEGR